MALAQQRQVAAKAVERACTDAGSVVELLRGVRAALEPAIHADRWCGFALDPATMFATNGVHDEGLSAHLVPRLLDLEHGALDHNQIPELARSPAGVSTIARATGGDPAASARWREVIVPSGLAHEMRAVFRDGPRPWGALVLLRASDVADFADEDLDFVRRMSPVIARGFQRVLVRQHLDHGDDVRETGILLLDGEPLAIRTATTAAEHWLAELDDGGHGGPLPTAVLSAAHATRLDPARTTTVRARTRQGRWLTIVADRLRDTDTAVGLVIQPSRPAEIAEIIGAAHGLTRRERDVVLLVASGHTNVEIARLLTVSPYTVADHLKSVFGKLDVASRGELTSKLFFDYYLPRTVAGRNAGSDGWFLPD
jgi:DNA-binding CsgD family transcriptional regulator